MFDGITTIRNDGFGAASTAGVSLFHFKAINFNYGFASLYGGSIKAGHDEFNRILTNAFPRQIQTPPFSTYSDSNFYADRFITASGESKLGPSETKAALLAIFKAAGFSNNWSTKIEFDQKTIQQLQQGQTLAPQTDAVNVKLLTSHQNTLADIRERGALAVGLDSTLEALFGSGKTNIFGYDVPNYAIYGAVALAAVAFISRR